ncbi:MAG: single-stranded DNA-binding protein [Podoviridae sp. ctbd591]|nr:MAG: single-stranded DNA-binding protein [Podoviridae sp. ctbd591]
MENNMSISKNSLINLETNETYTSFVPNTLEEQKRMFNAINNPNFRVGDMINKTINIADVILTGVELSDNDGYEGDTEKAARKAIRTILIDDNGNSYAATSDGISTSVKSLLSVFGTLHFDDPITVEIKQVTTKRGSLLTFVLV